MKPISGAALEVTRLTAAQLAERIADGSLSALKSIEAHIARIEAVNERLNAVVISLFEQARSQARAADAAHGRGEHIGPLHGVPITIKECFHVAGTDSTIGIRRFVGQPVADDGPLVKRLRRAGAIILGKTNVPQVMLLHETDNPVYGRTNNPWNLERSPGGSSGGEAAIIAAGGSPLGLASDLGGSIRQPAHSCGIHGLLPTKGRFTTSGSRNNFRGMEAIGVQPGPLARSVADLYLAIRALQASPNEVQEGEAPIPLLDPAQVDIGQLRVGFFTDDGYFPVSPAIHRAVREAAAALRTCGAHVEQFAVPQISEAMRIYFGLISAEGGRDVMRAIGRSPYDWRIRRLMRIARCPELLRRPLTWTLERIGQQRLAGLIGPTGHLGADRYWQMCAARKAYTETFLAAMNDSGLDALICPPHALPALRHGSTMHLAPAGSYCYLANVLGMPAGTVAATRVRPGEESDRPPSRDVVDRAAAEVERESAGLPIGVQILARHWREDIALAVMSALERHFSQQPDFPVNPPI